MVKTFTEREVRIRHNSNMRVWRRTNPVKNRTTQKNYQKRSRQNYHYIRNRLHVDPIFRLLRGMRNRIRLALTRRTKAGTTLDLLGCSAEFLEQWISKQFLPGMSWTNRHLWHIDHKKPLAKFDLSRESEQRMAFHYTNLQPLWAADNLRKGAH